MKKVHLKKIYLMVSALAALTLFLTACGGGGAQEARQVSAGLEDADPGAEDKGSGQDADPGAEDKESGQDADPGAEDKESGQDADPGAEGRETGAGGGSAQGTEGNSGIVLTNVYNAMVSELNIEDPLPVETARLYDLYGIEDAWVAQSANFVTMSGAFPDEIVLIEAVDRESAGLISEKLQARLGEVMAQARDYDGESYALAQKCSVTMDGLFVSLIFSPDVEELSEIYYRFIK